MNDYYHRVGRSATSYTLSQLCDSSSRLSRSRYQPRLRSMQSVQAPHVDTPNPVRRSATLEGRTRLICITPSSTRESWLKRAQSPSLSSSPSNIADYLSAPFPNSHSDGALVKRLASGVETRVPIKSKSPYKARFGQRVCTSYTLESTENGSSCSVSNEKGESFRSSTDRSVIPSSKMSDQIRDMVSRPQTVLGAPTPPVKHISRPSIPNLHSETGQLEGVKSTTAPKDSNTALVRLSKSSQFEPILKDGKIVGDKNQTKNVQPDDFSSLQPSKADSSPKRSRSLRKPKLMFTRALLEEKSSSPLIKVTFNTQEEIKYSVKTPEELQSSQGPPLSPQSICISKMMGISNTNFPTRVMVAWCVKYSFGISHHM
ncbi:hypothetical protein FGIG_03732 [Fasciola gigantica]|uniref:Uncharacterized protein n=1 Tax=Fasciola gigantica TaxID=46835 RepID=A0A504Y349_FASGI|nr:hypothetical protein FGIG_03732 [Fasciola gigantica]